MVCTTAMDFTEARFEGAAPAPQLTCAACRRPLETEYWTAGNSPVCANCAAQLRAGPPKEGGFIRGLKAFALGNGAGLLGAIGYGAIIYATGYELALITIGIGWFIGRAVMRGSDGRGGRAYQVMASLLTYVWCMEAFVPTIIKGAQESGSHDPIVVAIIAPVISLVMPFTGELNVISILILGFGVWRAWRETAGVVIPVAGPFAIAAPSPVEAAPAP